MRVFPRVGLDLHYLPVRRLHPEIGEKTGHRHPLEEWNGADRHQRCRTQHVVLVTVGEHREEQTDDAEARQRKFPPAFQDRGDDPQFRHTDEGGHERDVKRQQQNDSGDEGQDCPRPESHRSEAAGGGQQIPDEKVEVKAEAVIESGIHQQQQVGEVHRADRAAGHQVPPPRRFARLHRRDRDERGDQQAGDHVEKGVAERRRCHDGDGDSIPFRHAGEKIPDDGEHQHIDRHQIGRDRFKTGKP